MSKLEQLIRELCPNGAEEKRVDEVCDISRGRVMSKDYIRDNAGEYPVYSSQTENEGVLGLISTYDYEGEYLTWTTDGANAGSIFYRLGKFSITNVCGLLKVKSEDVLTRYLFYVLTIEAPKYVSRGMGNPKLMSNVMARIKIAIPPLQVQSEIVRILDNFRKLTAELRAELTAELTARKKQYEYYRDHLLTFDDKIPKVRLKDIATDIFRGFGIKRDQVTEDGIPCVRYGEIYTTYNTWFGKCVSHTQLEYVPSPKYFEYGDILFAITGESVKDIAKSIAYVGHEKCLAGGDIVVMKHKQNPKYLAYVLSTYDARQQKSKGKVKSKVVHSSILAIEDIVVPLPSLDTQERLVSVLDNFEAICSDLNICLPEEMEARQKQYEFYRDALLTFAETGEIIANKQTNKQTNRQSIIRLIQYVFGFAFVKLSDIATISRGGSFQKKDFCEIGVPCIHYGQIYTRYGVHTDKTIKFISEAIAKKQKKAVTNDVIMAVTSENVEDVCKSVAWLGADEVAVSGHTAIIHHNQNAKYLSYFFHTTMFFTQKRTLAHGTKVIEVTPDKLYDVIIPLPTLEEQERIVSILDRFDAICNDLTSGLPAEIEARQKQYEYYRDKLLTF